MTASTEPAKQGRRPRGGRLPTVLFWVGVMLTPIAGAGIWFAHGGGPLRGAALLALLGTVLIGLSVVLRRDSEGTRLELQGNLLAEVESLRTELGSAMTTALQRASHGTHAELAALQEQVDRLTGQLARPEPVAARTAPDERRAVPRRGGVPTPRPIDPLRDSMPRGLDAIRDSLPRGIDPVRDSMGGRGIDPIRDSMGGRGIDPVRDGRGPDPVRDSVGGRGIDPVRDSMGGRGIDPVRDGASAPPPVDPLRDSVSRLDPWADLRGGTKPAEPRRARHRHRAED
ncbi:MAG TPA: hypothetical protein VGN37_10765 [Actinocatenispora sp.]